MFIYPIIGLLLTGPSLTVDVIWGIATNCSLSLTTACVQMLSGAREKVANDLRLGIGFCCLL